ncbi:MAG: hypothetical protein L0211_26365 [Planctomycetaceae bacterium]|nr:hypothetical protein [Planctomycetaceae bacterium]
MKYAPAIGVLLLALAWGVSVFCWVGIVFPRCSTGGHFHAGIARGNAEVGFRSPPDRPGFHWDRGPWVLCPSFIVGRFEHDWSHQDVTGAGRLIYGQTECPIVCLITLLLPLAVGPLIGFRYRLWMFFVWLTTVAVESTYFADQARSLWLD